jgi:hypothetical protein
MITRLVPSVKQAPSFAICPFFLPPPPLFIFYFYTFCQAGTVVCNMSCVTDVRIEGGNAYDDVFVVLLYAIVDPFSEAILRVGEPCGSHMWAKDDIVSTVSKETCYGVKRDLLQRQKRHITVSKETCRYMWAKDDIVRLLAIPGHRAQILKIQWPSISPMW